MSDLLQEVQKEVARLRKMVDFTKSYFPKGAVNLYFYEEAIERAEKAIREHDTVTLLKILPELQKMD